VRSHLYVDGQDLIRVECVGGQLIVERYNQNLQLLASRRITSDLSAIWGGFFAGETDNYVVCGWSNPAETDDTEVLRIFQYDKDWNLKDQVSLYGANTQLPFRAASLRMAEFGGMLYIHTGHQMYRSHDGKNHQANMTLAIRQEGLDITDAQYLVSASYGYVSHSFNQFILIDEDGSIITLDHGDAYPRSAVLQKYVKPAGGDTFSGSYNTTIELDILELPGGIGANSTGASLGGLAKTSLGYLTAYNYNGIGEGYDTAPRDVFLSFTSKNNFSLSGTKTLRLTDYISDGDCSAGTPVLVSTGADEGYVLWEIKGQSSGGTVAYARYTADGSVSEIHTMKGALSDCQPILYNGKIIWYVTDDSAPKFYTLDTGSIPEESPITEINQMHIDGNEVLASVTWCQQTPGLAYCVFYDQGGQMLSVMSQTLETGENQITFPCPQNAVQVMIFAVNSNHVPQCAYATQKIN